MIKNDVLLNEEIDPKLVSEINLFFMEENSGSFDWKKFVLLWLLFPRTLACIRSISIFCAACEKCEMQTWLKIYNVWL